MLITFRKPMFLFTPDGLPPTAPAAPTIKPPEHPKPLTQADIDAAVKAALDKNKLDAEAAIKAREDEAEKKRLLAEGSFKELYKKLEAERDAEKAARAEAEKKAAREEARNKIAAELKLKPELAIDLVGDSVEEMKADHARRIEQAKKWAEQAGLKQQKSGGAPGPVAPGPAIALSKPSIEQKAAEIKKKMFGVG